MAFFLSVQSGITGRLSKCLGDIDAQPLIKPVHNEQWNGKMRRMMTSRQSLFIVALLSATPAFAKPFLVENGEARAEIIIAEAPQRGTRLAAQELQIYLEKISGAKLSIGDQASGELPVKIYIGESTHTEKLGITADGLKDGAYRIVSGEDWIVFIGDDTDFVPVEPWPRSNADIASGKMQAAWNKITGKHWGYTHSQMHKHYSGSNTRFGTPEEQIFDKNGKVNMWTYDERGSFNGVCAFLRDLGVRWYMPGEVGEVVPQQKSVPLPKIDRTVHPDFPMRILNFRTSVYGHDAMMWGFRLGVRQPWGRQAAHGLDGMTHNEHTLTHHPEWFALYGGKRHNQTGQRLNQLCYSNEELFREAVEFARAQFDHYDMDVVSIMPPDGYTAICQCQLCEGKDDPERGNRGALSNYVWEFVNRVAIEIGKTHPDKLISNCAYGIYTEPPTNIDKLEPNVQVIIVGGRRPTSEDREALRKLRAGWATKTDRPVEIFENYPFTARGFYLPAYMPRVLGESINETKGFSRGEDIWVSMDFSDKAIGYNHFLLYFTARMYWGGKGQDAAAMFDEYCDLFYGPVAEEMRKFFAYSEAHWREMESDGDKAAHALELFAVAKSKAEPGSIYEKRIALIDRYLDGLRSKSELLSQKRGPVPKLRLVGSEPLDAIVIDGQLDDKAWQDIAVASTGTMRELQTGRLPVYGTTIKTAWQKGSLHFAIRCDELPGNKPNITTTKSGDQAIWYGDVVEILLDTDAHSYYQIAVNPAGAVVDIDRGTEKSNWTSWSSQAEVATHIADDHWSVEIRIPVTQDENDPLHQVIGRKPTKSLPWHINVCRQRMRDDGTELSALSPTGTAGFHEPMKFAHFYGGLSFEFPADPNVHDYLIDSRAANQLMRSRKYQEAGDAYAKLAEMAGITDFQKSDALSFAASCARYADDFNQAKEHIDKIPLESVAKTARMENLFAQRKWQTVVEQFGDEDFATWPFWQRGAGAYVRGRAHAFTKNGSAAEADFQTALSYTPDPRIRTGILVIMGSNRETQLKDDDAALEAYRQIYEPLKQIGGADEYRAVLAAAAILTRRKKYDDALATIDRIAVDTQKGHWRHATLLALGDTLTAAGRTGEARKAYARVTDDDSASKLHREAAAAQLADLK